MAMDGVFSDDHFRSILSLSRDAALNEPISLSGFARQTNEHVPQAKSSKVDRPSIFPSPLQCNIRPVAGHGSRFPHDVALMLISRSFTICGGSSSVSIMSQVVYIRCSQAPEICHMGVRRTRYYETPLIVAEVFPQGACAHIVLPSLRLLLRHTYRCTSAPAVSAGVPGL